MANWCWNDLRFPRELTEDEMDKVKEAILKPSELSKYTEKDSDKNKYVLSAQKILSPKIIMSDAAHWSSPLDKLEVNKEKLLSYYYEKNPLNLKREQLIMLVDRLSLDIKHMPILHNALHEFTIDHPKMWMFLYNSLESPDVLKNQEILVRKRDANSREEWDYEINIYEHESLNFSTKWGPMSFEWFEKILNIFDNLFGRDFALGVTMYYEEPGCNVIGRYEAEDEDGTLVCVDNDSYSEYEEDEEEYEE